MTTADKPVLSIRTPGDLVAAAPRLLGFCPTESLVALFFGDGSFSARVDLPADPLQRMQLASTLTDAAIRNNMNAAALLCYTDRTEDAFAMAATGFYTFKAAGMKVLDVIHVREGGYATLTPDLDGWGATVIFDPDTTVLAAQATLAGRAVLGSREELTGLAAPEPVRADADAPQFAPFANAQTQDAYLFGCTRENSQQRLEQLLPLVRTAPDRLLPDVAATAGLVAWLAGNGALAWVLVDRAADVDPDHTLTGLVAAMLEGAVNPDEWAEIAKQ